jgi:2-polyprenyl-3-methyl-5-hydroxy-6-metoxy-1,4-benzoquinol methylase
MSNVSTNYVQIKPEDAAKIALEYRHAWQDPHIPYEQYKVATAELNAWRKGEPSAPFDAFVRCMRQIPDVELGVSVLDVGASAGYYGEVLEVAGFKARYTACDYSRHFERLAASLYPDQEFYTCDATALPFDRNEFDVVISGGTLMHIYEYADAIQQMARVAEKYVIFHRTPVFTERSTTFWLKDAYGIPCLEIHFNEEELIFKHFRDAGLRFVYSTNVFWNHDEDFGHRSYLLAKT